MTGYRHAFPVLEPYAAFLNVDAQGINPTDFGPYSIDVDEVLNLSGLDGEPLPAAALVNVYHFEGENNQGHPVELFAVELGRWLYMQGESRPGCCDMFKYDIKALARQRPFPDLTNDGLVNGLDLDYWEAHVGLDDSGDVDGNGVTDGADFLVLQREFGSEPPPLEFLESVASAAAASAALAAVPEPGSLALLLTGSVLLVWRRRRAS